ncbi:hypothetical protein, partial [Trueperella sp.]|uniref:hypothetical protein n=1 Tax=Trueperella sp. TaxID=2699835 RepID=UPI003734F333
APAGDSNPGAFQSGRATAETETTFENQRAVSWAHGGKVITDVASLSISALGLVIAFIALFVALQQLRHDETANGGRGMKLTLHEVGYPEKIPNHVVPVVPIDFAIRVAGPAQFFEVLPCTWADEGAPIVNGEPISRLTCDDDPVEVRVYVTHPIPPNFHFGVLWREPYRGGLQTGGLRTTISGEQLHSWRYFPRPVARIRRRQGRWVPQPDEKELFGPASPSGKN